MNEIRTLYRHASHYLSGRVCLMLIGFLSFPILTRIFSVADYGVMGLVLKIVLLFTVIGKFGLQNSVQRFYAEDGASTDAAKRRKYYATLFFGAGSFGALSTLIFLFAVFVLPSRLIDVHWRFLFALASVLILIRSLQPTLIGFLRAQGRTKAYNLVEIALRAATVILACTILLTWRRSLTVFFASTIGIELLGVLALTLYFSKLGLLDIKFLDWQYLRNCALFAFPLIGYELASVILDSGDRLLVQHFMGAQPLGYYSAAYNVSTYAEEALMVPINLALFPIYMKLWVEKGKRETELFLSRSLNNFMTLAIGIVCVVLLTSRDVIIVLASSKFQEAHRLLPILVVGLLIYATHIFFNAALLIHKRTATMTTLVVYACIVNVGLNILLVPRIGLQGAALATLLSYLFLVVLMAKASSKLLSLRINYLGFGWNLVAAILTFVAIRHLQLPGAFRNAIAKGTLAIILYALLLCVLNSEIRVSVFEWIKRPGRAADSNRSEFVVT